MLYRGARILILDEPTAVLVPQEVDELFGNLRELKSEGLTIIFISHKLDEVRSVADEITVIRPGDHGRHRQSQDRDQPPAGRDDGRLRSCRCRSCGTRRSRDRVVLSMDGVTVQGPAGRPALSDVTLRIHAGEVLGIAGVEGNGQGELVDAIMGIWSHSRRNGHAWPAPTSPKLSTLGRRESGIGFIPEDRHRQGLMLEATLWENRMLGHQTRPPAAKGFFVDRRGRQGRCPADRRAVRRADPGHRRAGRGLVRR